MLGSFYRTFYSKFACFGFIKKFQILFEKIEKHVAKNIILGPRNDFFGLFIKGKKSFKFDNKGLKTYPKIVSDSVFKKKNAGVGTSFYSFHSKNDVSSHF